MTLLFISTSHVVTYVADYCMYYVAMDRLQSKSHFSLNGNQSVLTSWKTVDATINFKLIKDWIELSETELACYLVWHKYTFDLFSEIVNLRRKAAVNHI